jgi:hypothetical protein
MSCIQFRQTVLPYVLLLNAVATAAHPKHRISETAARGPETGTRKPEMIKVKRLSTEVGMVNYYVDHGDMDAILRNNRSSGDRLQPHVHTARMFLLVLNFFFLQLFARVFKDSTII